MADAKSQANHPRAGRDGGDKARAAVGGAGGGGGVTAAGRREDALVRATWTTHAGWLRPVLLALSASFPPLSATLVVFLAYLTLLLISPVAFQPAISAAVTLLVPVQSTARSLSAEPQGAGRGGGGGGGGGQDAPQWLVYWPAYAALDAARGWVGIYRPNARWVFEVWRGVVLAVLASGWFGRAVLRPEGARDR
ncbi:hypothetical protein Q5752_006028 [Cryptotrichosporon argae]